MKTIIITLVLFKSVIVFGQQDAKTQIRSTLIQMLKEDDILLSEDIRSCTTNCLWKKEKQKKRILERDDRMKDKLLEKFIVPTFCASKTINKSYVFINQSISKLGSYIIRNGNFSIVNTTQIPDLPILLTGRQLSIIDPNSSNYLLNYTTEKLFKDQSTVGLEADFKEYFNSKQSLSFNTEDNKRTTLTLGAGVFKNELAELFQKTSENRITTKEFYALYDIWVKYSLNQISQGDSVIKAFEGICYYKSKGVDNNSKLQYDAELNAGYKFAFLSLNTSNKLNWGNYSSIQATAETYDIYMFNRPQMAVIPKPEEILANWKRLSNIPDAVIQESDNIPNSKPLEIQVKFGPIVNPEFISNIKLDEDYTLSKLDATKKFIKKIELINAPGKYTYDDVTNIVTFVVKIHRDEDFINLYANNSPLSVNCDLRLYYDQPVKINSLDRTLEILYKGIPISTEVKPSPIVSENIIKSEKNGNNYIFKFNGIFNTNIGQNISTSPRPLVSDVLNLPIQTTSNLKERIINTVFTLKANNTFDAVITIPSSIRAFSSNVREMNIELVVKFTDSRSVFLRKIPITLLAPDEQIEVDSTSILPISFNTTESLMGSLNDNSLFNDGTSVKSLKDQFTNTSTGEFNVNGFMEELKKKAEITISPDAKYFIKPMFIDNSKLKSNSK